jgi:hypothetical protein
MSHYWNLRCPACGGESDSYNHAAPELRRTVERSASLFAALDDGWGVSDPSLAPSISCGAPVVSFLLAHRECPAEHFEVVSEYPSEPVQKVDRPKPPPPHPSCSD